MHPRPHLFALPLLFVLACAHDVRVRYPASADEATGSIALVFTNPASPVNVVVNGTLVVRGARTEHITITDVPTGFAEVAIAVGAGEKQVRVWIDTDRETTVPVGAADEAPLTAVRTFAMSMASLAVYLLLR